MDADDYNKTFAKKAYAEFTFRPPFYEDKFILQENDKFSSLYPHSLQEGYSRRVPAIFENGRYSVVTELVTVRHNELVPLVNDLVGLQRWSDEFDKPLQLLSLDGETPAYINGLGKRKTPSFHFYWVKLSGYLSTELIAWMTGIGDMSNFNISPS